MFSYMELLLFIIVIILLWWWHYSTNIHRKLLPPGPFPLPIIGNLHLLGNLPHRALHKLSQKYGPIMFLRLGSINTIVVSSPDAAKLFIRDHDAAFSTRLNAQISKYLYYDNKGILLREYGDYWRNVRKLCTIELFSPKRMKEFAPMREEEIGLMVDEVSAAVMDRKVMNLSELIGRVIEGMTSRMLFGKKNAFTKLLDEWGQLLGVFNLADYVPMLAPFDLQGLIPRFMSLSKELDAIFEASINEHEERNAKNLQGSNEMNFVNILLSEREKYSFTQNGVLNKLDRSSIKAILVDMIVGGIDTSRTSIEWILSMLIKHPRVMKKLQKEIKTIVGDKRIVNESDLQELSYLHMIVKETFRLYPTAPLLFPRVSTQDVVVDGYNIPKNTQLLVNVWAFGRDPKVWSENWTEFLPERFADNEINFRGHDFQLMHFSTGRRGCPAMNMGLLSTCLVVSNLVNLFDWMLPDATSANDMDMNEKYAITMPKVKPLLVTPSYHMDI